MADVETLSNEIDALLERYLDLLNTYTCLRAQLNTTQASFHQNLSRANFTSPTNTRYDSSSYPASLTATRLTSITPTSPKDPPSPSPSASPNPTTSISTIPQPGAKDPILIFGLLTPPSLKAAQNDAVRVVGELVPELIRVDKEMRGLEIEVRRRRKFRGRAEERVGKEKEKVGGERREEGVVV